MRNDYWNIKYLSPPTNYIFGFGTTINKKSRNTTSIDIGNSIPVRISKYFSHRRCWNFVSLDSKFTALGLEKTNIENSSTINGIIYPVDKNIIDFDNREEGYYRVNIPLSLIEAINWEELPKHKCDIWVYIPKKKYTNIPDKYNPILQSYIDVCIDGCLCYGRDYTIEFLETTYNWNKYWLNDREISRRPWIYQKNYKIIDELLRNYPSHNNTFISRLLEVEYSIHFTPNIV